MENRAHGDGRHGWRVTPALTPPSTASAQLPDVVASLITAFGAPTRSASSRRERSTCRLCPENEPRNRRIGFPTLPRCVIVIRVPVPSGCSDHAQVPAGCRLSSRRSATSRRGASSSFTENDIDPCCMESRTAFHRASAAMGATMVRATTCSRGVARPPMMSAITTAPMAAITNRIQYTTDYATGAGWSSAARTRLTSSRAVNGFERNVRSSVRRSPSSVSSSA